MPRKEFITKFPGNEANLSWVTELAKSDEPWAEKVANQEIDILRSQRKLAQIEKTQRHECRRD